MYSVVVPVYQAKESLRRCVDSWLSQTEGNWELILVDDGSTDGSAGICDELSQKDVRIHVIHQENAGVSAARNAGICAASGEFLLFTDSDDYVAADYLEKMSRFQKETGSDLVLCGFHHLYDGADILKVPKKTYSCALADFSEEFLKLYERSYLNMPWNKLFRRAWAEEFDPSVSLGEDLLFNLDYLRKCSRIAVLSEPLCYYIQEEQKRTLSSKRRTDRLLLARRVCEETEKFYQDIWGAPGTCDPEASGRIFTRYMNEVMDECGKLPSDKSLSLRGRLKVIKSYAEDAWVQKRGDEAALPYLDYRILWFFLKRKRIRMVYVLCVLRRIAVLIAHRIRRR